VTETATAAPETVWRRPRTATAYLSWCMVVRNSKLDLLENALKSLRDRAPDSEIVIVETCGKNAAEILALAQKYADVFEQYRGPNGTWNEEMYAVDDMAVARQRSFELASGTWRAWVDDDDRVVAGREAQALLEKNGQWKPPAREGQRTFEPEKDAAVPVAGSEGGQDAVTIEDLLRWTEKNQPSVTMLWCPYLYQKDEKGHAIQWLWRERFARWDDPTRFHWAEPAHEVLVPRAGYLPPRVELPHLLWVHEKTWDGAAFDYSLKRHSAIMLAQHDSGDVTFRRARYLAGFATVQALGFAHRELELWEAALKAAWTSLDRYRARIGLGGYYARRGLTWEARDHFAAAQAISPGLPDAWYASGQAAVEREDWATAVEHIRRGVECKMHPESEVNPREHMVSWPSKLAIVLQKLAKVYREAGRADAAVAALHESRDLAFKVLGRPEVGDDKTEANILFCRAENRFNSEQAVVMLHQTWQHLRRNDETQKALGVVDLLPHDQQHHPLAVEMETWSRKIWKHVNSPQAYAEFYNSQETGWEPLALDFLTYKLAHPRVRWSIDWVRKNMPTASVLDVGSCDGVTGVPLLRELPTIRYHGVDVGARFLDSFAGHLKDAGVAELVHDSATDTSRSPNGSIVLERGTLPKEPTLFDVIMLGEIIEHVPDPIDWLDEIMLRHLKPGGAILLSTPWGSFDEGHPPEENYQGQPRDERGHVRAYSVWQLVRDVRDAGGRVEAVEHLALQGGGDAMCAVIRHEVWREKSKVVGGVDEAVRVSLLARPVAVYVAGALWEWNGSKVDREGIGASEEMIVRMGEKLAPSRTYDVFGPVPEEEVWKGVGYFPQRAIRKVEAGTKLLVSRSPASIQRIDEWLGSKADAVLWLQDTHYPDLTPEIAERYETIVCVSDWHSELVARTVYGEAWRQEVWPKSEGGSGRIRTIYNWVDRSHFQAGLDAGWKDVKLPHHFIYASSPDRGLLKLLELWPRVLDLYPDATLSVFYGWKGASRLGDGHADSNWNQRYLKSRRRYEELRHQKGVHEVGMVDHYRVALEFQKAAAMLYPGDFHETFGTVASKAGAAGCVPVISDLAGLKESANFPYAEKINLVAIDGKHQPGYDDAWLEGVRRAVELSTEQRQIMARAALDRFSWEAVEAKWAEVLS
jgi:glycosyltransferase involved in cell wall biosynthesis/2-polyprenyl-3-methyl-5-hydroxy-6-metoxy-1,4-benzoquinol methylase